MKEVKKYQKKPVVIEAIQWNGENLNEILQWCRGKAKYEAMSSGRNLITIETLESDNSVGTKHAAIIGDYIVKGVKGEFYPCKPDIFEATYAALSELTSTNNLELHRQLTFDELIQHGLQHGANVENGMPWSWKINGKAITHENDDVYLVETMDGIERFERYGGKVLSACENGLFLLIKSRPNTHAPSGCPL